MTLCAIDDQIVAKSSMIEVQAFWIFRIQKETYLNIDCDYHSHSI